MSSRRLCVLLLCGSLWALLAGCGGAPDDDHGTAVAPDDGSAPIETETVDAELPEVVRRAVAVAREIEDDPEAVEAILERHGLTPESFDELMYEISSDAELAEQYRKAME